MIKHRNQVKQIELKCPICGNVFPIFRKQSNLKEKGHKKKLWCWKCKKERNFIETE